MSRGLSFRDAAALVGETHPVFKALDRILGGALLVATAGGSEAASALFDAKSEFIDKATSLGQSLLDAGRGLDRFGRAQRTEAANSVLIVASFFETLALIDDRAFFIDPKHKAPDHRDWRRVPVGVSEVIARTVRRRVRDAQEEQLRRSGVITPTMPRPVIAQKLQDEKPHLPKDKVHQILVATSVAPQDERIASVTGTLLSSGLPAPAPHRPFEDVLQQLSIMYRELALTYAPASLGIDWDTLDTNVQASYASSLGDWVATAALARYKDQFQRLAGEFPEVAYWANAIEHQATRREIEDLKIGLAGLVEGFELGGLGQVGTADAASRGLSLVYAASLQKPIVESGELPVSGVALPNLEQIYVNPEFRALEADPSTRLELEETWHQSEAGRRRDLQSFLVGYFATPSATATPLLILGQPGSGKSVLTRVLAARLPSTEFLVVRIVLREIPADDDVQSQIEAAILSATGERLSWPELAARAREAIPVLLFDGFDELLQSTGVTQSDFLERVARFQERESDLGRPCVTAVTSRTAVADRARVPTRGLTAIRLEPFSNEQVERWVDVWNGFNRESFNTRGIEQLSVSDALAQGELARQPLLLLMLAIYDSDANSLANMSSGGQRSKVYEQLLDVFASRELLKSATPENEDRADLLKRDRIAELSRAAVAMFNRGRQWILLDELNSDIAALHATGSGDLRETVDGFRISLSKGEVLLGRFFFVHEARAIVGGTQLGTIEFLHATFGEYLVAKAVASELANVLAQEELNRQFGRRSPVATEHLTSLLGFAQLSSRATILEFLRELLERAADRTSLRDSLLGLFRSSMEVPGGPAWASGYLPQPVSSISRYANYSANLLIILLLVDGRVRASDLFPDREDANEAWARFAMLLRSQLATEAWRWFSANVQCYRELLANGSSRLSEVRLVDPTSPDLPLDELEESVDGDWHFPLRELGPGAVATVDDYARVIVSNRLVADPDLDLALRALGPLLSEFGPLLTCVLARPDGTRVSGLEALVGLWLASASRFPDAKLSDAYEDCIALALNGLDGIPEPVATRFRALLVRQLGNDLTRLPGAWREQTKTMMISGAASDDAKRLWIQQMTASLGLGRAR